MKIKDKVVLVTGGCGSIGSEIVRQVLEDGPAEVRVFDQDESNQYFLAHRLNDSRLLSVIGDIRDRDRLRQSMEGVDIVFHSAALKHVPLCENNPFEAVKTNVIGTQNVLDAARKSGVKALVGISTDKAVNPVNTMGATKLLSERVIVNSPLDGSDLVVSVVRFGNVLDSIGSVVPLFREQLRSGKPITVTSKEMTRFFMTISQAVKLSLDAVQIMKGREVFILKMPALNIGDLANAMIQSFSLTLQPSDPKPQLEYKGRRAGEKFHELLFSDYEAPYIEEQENLYILRNSPFDPGAQIRNEFSQGLSSERTPLLNVLEIRDILENNKLI